MHLLRTETRTLDEAADAVDLDLTPADVVALSFTDSDLSVLAAAWDGARHPGLRLARLAQLKHPYSVDILLERIGARARFVLVRLLGGLDYWRYGVEELAAAARARGFDLAVVPGDHREDPRLDAASTLPVADLRRIWAWFQHGGPDNCASCLGWIAERIGRPGGWREPQPVPAFALHDMFRREAEPGAARALLVFYRSVLMAADTAPIAALADALAERGFGVEAGSVTSLKDPAAAEAIAAHLACVPPDAILNTTAFSGRLDDGACVLDRADAPVFQVMLSGARREAWEASGRGLGAADLAMNVVLPEVDGRIVTRAVSFKAEEDRHEALEFARTVHRPEPSRVAFVADLAAAWARLRRTPRAERRLACVLSDYPAKGGRTGYAVGLDTARSVAAIAADLAAAGFDTHGLPAPDGLMRLLEDAPARSRLSLVDYHRLFWALPEAFRLSVSTRWGAPEDDESIVGDAFAFRGLQAGKMVVALQPARGHAAERKADHHDAALPPRHGYVAFYLWLREIERIHALIHCGTHGTLEWLPGKAAALTLECAPEAVLGPVPVVYPFIVNNPGEAAQAKRRIAAVTVGHLTPPLAEAGTHGATMEIEALLDEYVGAEGLDARRARLLAETILSRAVDTGLAEEAGIAAAGDPQMALQRLDAWLCDIKEMRIGDGLHVFGRTVDRAMLDLGGGSLAVADDPACTRDLLASCADAERAGLLAALDGRFVPPGPAGAPSRGRLDVLPTGRNLFTVDPRSVPTRTAWEIGRRMAQEVVNRYAQDHGDWPRSIVIDLWGSATMRTGGDDLAQALALIGVRPVWDHASARVSGFEVLPPAVLGRPRVDVTLRISGLFRDVFPQQIALFDEAVRAVSERSEEGEDNPLAQAAAMLPAEAPRRVFGAAPGAYGLGVGQRLQAGDWEGRSELGESYLAATSHAYGAGAEAESGLAAADAFRERVAVADAFLHVQDMAGQDILDSDAFAEHEGGFAAAAAALGGSPVLYHADATDPSCPKVRTVREEIARVLRARATNPRWIEGQIRHGHRGAAEIAETVDNLFAYAALTDAVASRHFDLLFDATCADERVRDFLMSENPRAAQSIARRFAEAEQRGFWTSRRNSSAATLHLMLESTA
jgi:cobaltochelatase CobN